MTELLCILATYLLIAMAIAVGVAIVLGEIDDRRRSDLAQLRLEIDDLCRHVFNRHNL
jgi:hypothetical protein